MKKLTFLLAFMLLAALTTKATVHTVSNDVNNPAEYSNINTAHDAASVGDTLLVYGSTTDYCNLIGTFYIKKRLCIIGAGYNPNNQFGNETLISSIMLDSVTGVYGASGSEITGIYCASINVSTIINHVRIHRNYFSQYVNLSSKACKDWKIYNNVFDSYRYQYGNMSTWNSSYSINLLIANNIFTNKSHIGWTNSTTLITNNLFLPHASGSGVGSTCLMTCNNSTVTNNIFYMRSTIGSNCSQNTLSNNIGYGTATIVSGSNMGSNNTITDPKFIYVGTNQGFDYNDNYNLQSSSPAINAGSDNTDIGIYGGPFPFPEGYGNSYRYAAMPNIPIIMDMNLNTTNIPQNTNLNFTIKARKGDE